MSQSFRTVKSKTKTKFTSKVFPSIHDTLTPPIYELSIQFEFTCKENLKKDTYFKNTK